MFLRVGYVRFWLLKVFGYFLGWLESRYDNWLVKGFYGICRIFWEMVSPSMVFRVVAFSDYASNHNVTVFPIKTNRVGYAANAVCVNKGEKQILKEVALPDLNLYCLNNVSIHHGSDFIANVRERIVINDYCAKKNDENKGYEDQWCYLQEGHVAILRKSKPKKHLKAVIMMNDKYSFNYYHNMYENLVRLCILDEYNKQISDKVPVIVDEDIFKVSSFKRIYDLLSKNINRTVVIAKKDDLFFVDELYYISRVNNLVPLHKDSTKGRIEDYLFDKEYTLKLRDKLLIHRNQTTKTPNRIFITRKHTTKRHFNEDELYAVLKPYGFQMVAPEEFTFEEQMTLFNNAEWIVTGSGAALTNLLFVSVSCVVICLIRKSSYIPPVFSPLVCFNKARMYLFQPSNGEGIKNVHANFTIDVGDFRQFVKECVEPAILNKS